MGIRLTIYLNLLTITYKNPLQNAERTLKYTICPKITLGKLFIQGGYQRGSRVIVREKIFPDAPNELRIVHG